MKSHADNPAKLPSRRRRLIVAILVVSLTPALLTLAGYVCFRVSYASAIRKLEGEVRQRGEPITLAELQAQYPTIPDQDNAAVPLLALWRREAPLLWEAFDRGVHFLPQPPAQRFDPYLPYLGSRAKQMPRAATLSPDSLAAGEAYLKDKASYLDAVRAALRRPGFRFPLKLEEGVQAISPHISFLTQDARNFLIAAVVASDMGDRASAVAALQDTVSTAQLLSHEPLLTSQLARIGCLGMAMAGTEQLLSQKVPDSTELRKLSQMFDQMDVHGVARYCLVNERPFALSVFGQEDGVSGATGRPSNGETGDAHSGGRDGGGTILDTLGLRAPDQRYMLEQFQTVISLAGRETPESLAAVDGLCDQVSSNALRFPPKHYSHMMLPALRNIPFRFATFEARRRAGLTALAVERYRLEHADQLPEKLADLVPSHIPAVLLDPFDGQALRYRRLERGYVIYSVGRDRHNDGGREHGIEADHQSDVTFTVER